MLIKINQVVNTILIEKFLIKNNINRFHIERNESSMNIDIQDELTHLEYRILKRHLEFYDILYWSDKGIENITLWEKPHRIKEVINELNTFYRVNDYDLIVSIEAKGFIIGGMLSYALQKPLLTVRKFKPIYDSLPGMKHTYVNWKNESETLYIFKNNDFQNKKALFVDDLLDTGRSLEAVEEMLKKENIDIIGAFYLCDCIPTENRNQLNYPVKSLLRFNDLFNNK